MSESSRYYDAHLRNPQAKQFYNSSAWKQTRRNVLADRPWCTRCNDGTPAAHVHHVIPIATPEGWEKRLDPSGLMPVCVACHNAIEREASQKQVPTVSGILVPQEDDEFYFDAEAADRPVRFIQKYCRHYEGKWAGETLQLLDWQQQLVRTLYGWRSRQTHRRRFRELFLLSGKGAGKTPFLSSIGQYELFAGGEQAPHVVSMATNFKQANLTFDWAKRSISQDRQLSKRSIRLQYEIRNPANNGKWNTISGTFSGNAGFRPSVIIGDEVWEWPNEKLYNNTTANLFKRLEPLLLLATNAGESNNCFAWHLYEQAKAVLAGKSQRTDLLPAIFEAPESLPWDSEEAARAACPSIPDVITFESLQPKIIAAREDPTKLAEYRRLHLSHWIADATARKWLDLGQWDACLGEIVPEAIKNAALYVGLDLSEGDDLCSAVFVWVTPEKMYVRPLFWLPKETADHYEAKNGIPYSRWAKAGQITLLDSPTIGPKVRQQIAAEIIEQAKAYQLKAIAYDRYRADEAVAHLEAAGIHTEKTGQGWGVSPGCAELERRLKEKSIVIEANPVLRAHAEIVEVKPDDRGNFWPIKPNAKGTYAGTRSAKIDGIAALVTALVHARKHEWPKAQQMYMGQIYTISRNGPRKPK